MSNNGKHKQVNHGDNNDIKNKKATSDGEVCSRQN